MADDNSTYADYAWLDEVLKRDPDHYLPEPDVYEFSDGRKFESTDGESTGIYSES